MLVSHCDFNIGSYIEFSKCVLEYFLVISYCLATIDFFLDRFLKWAQSNNN